MGASRPEPEPARRRRRPGSILSSGLLALATLPALLSAQQEAAPVMEGRVLRDSVPLDTAVVVLHRVGVDTAGEIDSVRAGAEGRFRFDLPTVPDPGGRGEVYFASVRHQGILYFGTAIHRADQLDSLYVIEVHDTAVVAPGGSGLALEIRYVVAEPTAEGWQITDLFQVRNPGARTLVPGEEGRTVWAHPLPADAREVRIGEGDVPPDAMTFQDGVFRVLAPVPPGQRHFVVRYLLDDLETTLPLDTRVGQMELLVREPAPPLDVTGLTPAEPIEMEQGLTYRRYTGADLPAGAVVLEAGAGPRELPVEMLAIGLATLLTVVGLWAYLRTRSRSPVPASGPNRAPGPAAGAGGRPGPTSPRHALLLEVARIDEALESDDLDEGEAARLHGRRTSLVRRLQDMG